jgi:hypothetical protein
MTASTKRLGALVAFTLALAWWLASAGIVSSNDGSHVALGRALALRHTTSIDPDIALTLWVDRAEREGRAYSDRPPGTAFAALPAVWLGARLDQPLLSRSLATRELVVQPAADAFADTYAARSQRLRVNAVPLLALQGTALMAVLQAIAMGLLGVLGVDAILRRDGVAISARIFAALGLGLGTLWGPYSTALFSHVTTGTMIVLGVLAIDRARTAIDRPRAAIGWAALAGLLGAWAIASDYLALLLALPIFAVAMPWRVQPRLALWLVIGGLPIAIATLAYHHAAFGSPWSIGYDHHANFAFARARGSTFDGNPLEGLWTLFGLGHGAGVIAVAPLTLLGVWGLWASPHRRWLLACVPWTLALALHHTPWGGASQDHRYLVPALPLLGVGLGHAWAFAACRPRAQAILVALVGLAVLSAALAWMHFVAARS